MAYECLAGAPPFSGMAIEVALAHRDRPPPRLPAAIPGEVDVVVAAMIAKDPAARPAAAEVAHHAGSLRGALAGSATISLNSAHALPVTPDRGAARNRGRFPAQHAGRRSGSG